MRVVKNYNTVEQRDAAYAFYQSIGSYAPPEVDRQGNYTLRNMFVPGCYPHLWLHDVLYALERIHSGDDEPLPLDMDEYIGNLHKRAGVAFRLQHTLKVLEKYGHKAQPVFGTVHGDCTLGNVIRKRDGDLVFIDPANPRGMPCVELDQSKLMQSLDGWEVIKYGLPQAVVCPTDWPRLEPNPLHYAFLATHYWRMLPYQVGDEQATRFAEMRLRELEGLCQHFV